MVYPKERVGARSAPTSSLSGVEAWHSYLQEFERALSLLSQLWLRNEDPKWEDWGDELFALLEGWPPKRSAAVAPGPSGDDSDAVYNDDGEELEP